MELPPALTPNESRAATMRLLKGDTTARDELICGSLRLITSIAHEAARKYQIPWDDLFSVGCLALVQAVDAIRDARNPPAYFSQRVWGAICNEFWRQRKMVALPDLVAVQSPTESEIEDVIVEAAENATDQEILCLRCNGATLTEIALRVDRPRSSIHDRLEYLRQKISRNFTV